MEKKIFLIVIAAILAGCASEPIQQCEKINGKEVCTQERPERPRAGRN